MLLSEPETFSLSRRQLIKTSMLGSLALTSVSFWMNTTSSALAQEGAYAFLTKADATLMQALARGVLSDILPASPEERQKSLASIPQPIDYYISSLSPTIQTEIREAFDLLEFTPVRWGLARVWSPWEEASDAEIQAFLLRWKNSSIELFRSLYVFLHTMAIVGWYASPQSWKALGYPGPPDIPRPEGEEQL